MSEDTFSDTSSHITRICVKNNEEVYTHDSPLLSDYATKSEEIGWIISLISCIREAKATLYLL